MQVVLRGVKVAICSGLDIPDNVNAGEYSFGRVGRSAECGVEFP